MAREQVRLHLAKRPGCRKARKDDETVNRVIVVGSPRVDGRSASLADDLLYACIEECPDDAVSIVSVASTRVEPCRGCDACARVADDLPPEREEGDPLTPHPAIAASDAARHRCVIDDDMPEVRAHLDAADELIVVSPVYFSGPPAQFKALLDRLQPYYRSDARTRVKRPMILHVVGEGGDPHGYDALVSTVMSAFGVAGFRLESIFDWVGKISADGEILGDPEEYALAGATAADAPGETDGFVAAERAAVDGEDGVFESGAAGESEASRGFAPLTEAASMRDAGAARAPRKEKPRLSLSQPAKGGKRQAAERDGMRESGARRKGGFSKQARQGGAGSGSAGRSPKGGSKGGVTRGASSKGGSSRGASSKGRSPKSKGGRRG